MLSTGDSSPPPSTPFAGRAAADADVAAAPFGEQVGAAQRRPGPHRLDLDLGIVAEPRRPRDRQAEIDRIAIVVGREAEAEADRAAAAGALHRRLAAAHRVADPLGTGPQRRGESALRRERRDRPAERDVGQQSQRPVEARLAAAVGPGDDVERAEGERHVAQRAITGDGEAGDQSPSPAPPDPALTPNSR